MRRVWHVLAVLVIGASFAAPHACAADLVLGAAVEPDSIDPHVHNFGGNKSLMPNLFEALTTTDANDHLVANLAVSWQAIDATTWEFRLRPGVRFSDGTKLTADDVAFTLRRVPNVPTTVADFSEYVKPIAQVEVVDAATVRLHTKVPFPLAPEYLSTIGIVSRLHGEGASTADYNDGKAAIGTGPFRFVAYKPGDRVELERYDGYWGPKPAWQHVTWRFIPNDASRVAALLAGDVDFIDFVPTEDLQKLRSDPKVKVWEQLGLRIIFLALDQSRDGGSPFVSGPNGEKLDKNPLKDQRVREALSIAINRQAIVDRVMEGAAVPSGQFLPPGTFGYVPDLKAPPYDPAQAKKLLAEAGYPNGFRIALHGPNDRYVNDARIIQAVGQMWQRIGVQTEVDPLPWTSYVSQANKQAFSAFLFGWGSGTAEPSDPLIAQVATFDPAKGWGASNRGRYSNPALDKLIGEALGTADDNAREKMLQDATRMAMQDVAIIPLHIQKNIWATRASLTYVPTVGEGLMLVNVKAAQ